jgi:dolichol-phosphate mannosyltransferase
MKVVIVLPTYNERENVVPLLDALQVQFDALPGHDMNVLVVDDGSPDGTADVVRGEMARRPNLHLVTGRKEGLGAAYVRGMGHAVDALAADVVFSMDADFSHDPADVPRLLRTLESPADLAIGSRYVRGGSIPAEWAFYRKVNSTVGNLVARGLAGLYRYHDCTAGFRAYRASLLKQIDLPSVKVRGYAFQVAMLHRAVTSGAVVKEIPIHFRDRTRGQSKLGVRDIVEFILNAWWIRLRTLGTFVRFAAVGLVGVAVNLAAFVLLLRAGVSRFVASPVAVVLSIATNLLLNRLWTFGRGAPDRSDIRGARFNVVSLVTLAVSVGTFLAAGALFPDRPPWLHQLAGVPPAMLVNYFLNSYWTFRDA